VGENLQTVWLRGREVGRAAVGSRNKWMLGGAAFKRVGGGEKGVGWCGKLAGESGGRRVKGTLHLG